MDPRARQGDASTSPAKAAPTRLTAPARGVRVVNAARGARNGPQHPRDAMRIAFVNPPPVGGMRFIREGRCMQSVASWAALWPPLAALLETLTETVSLYDGTARPLSPGGDCESEYCESDAPTPGAY